MYRPREPADQVVVPSHSGPCTSGSGHIGERRDIRMLVSGVAIVLVARLAVLERVTIIPCAEIAIASWKYE